MHACGFHLNSLTLVYSYLESREQNVKIYNIYSIFQILLSSVLQRSILRPILFSNFTNDLRMSTKNSDLYNIADDNSLTSLSYTLSQLIKNLQSEGNKVTDWFKKNNMIVNFHKQCKF